MPFCIVEFVYSNATSDIAVVPLSWVKLSEKKCYWPSCQKSSAITELVSKQALPEGTWDQYSVKKTIGGVYETELEARQKQNLAVDTSDVNTDHGKKRRRKPIKAFSSIAPAKWSKPPKKLSPPVYSEDSSEDSDAPVPLPTLGNTGTNENFVTSNVAGKGGAVARNADSQDAQPQSGSSLQKQVLGAVSDSDIESQEHSGLNLVDLVTQTRDAGTSKSRQNLSSENTSFGQTSNTSMERDFQREVLHSLAVIKTRIKHVEETQEILLHRGFPETVKRTWKLKLPAESVSDVLRLDALLIEDENEKDLEIRINKLGGMDVGKCTRNILRKVLTDEAAQGLNWRGQNGKVALAQLRLTTLITDSVIGFLGSTKATTALVEDSIKEWLKQASNRISQKLKRQQLVPSDDSPSMLIMQ